MSGRLSAKYHTSGIVLNVSGVRRINGAGRTRSAEPVEAPVSAMAAAMRMSRMTPFLFL